MSMTSDGNNEYMRASAASAAQLSPLDVWDVTGSSVIWPTPRLDEEEHPALESTRGMQGPFEVIAHTQLLGCLECSCPRVGYASLPSCWLFGV